MIIGIDPGLSGAMAVYDWRALQGVTDLPIVMMGKKTRLDVAAFATCMADQHGSDSETAAYLENVSAMPRQGVSSSFNFGRTFGEIHGVLVALGFTVHLVTPKAWKFAVGLRSTPGADTKARKTASRELARQLFPNRADQFARVKDDGRAEAALIAYYGAMQGAKS
jgi:crossover junction endodeoxyribonuclease RuvC